MWWTGIGCVAEPPAGQPLGEGLRVELSDEVRCEADERGPWTALQVGDFPRPAEAELDSGGLAIGDLDDDGHLDLFLPHFSRSGLWFGTPDGRFRDASDALAGLDLADAVGAVAADLDGDGDLDLLVTRWRRPLALLANDGAGGFTDVTERAGLGGGEDRTQALAVADVDLDGDLDAYVGSYGPEPSDEFSFDDPSIPASPDRKHLWLQQAPGWFADHAELLPADVQDGYGFSATWLDTTGDALPELFLWNDFGTAHPSRALTNDGRAFGDEPGSTGVDRPFEDMGVAIADWNGDGLPDFATTSYRRLGLLLSTAVGGPAGGVWIDGAGAAGLHVSGTQEFGWGIDAGDLDHDGDEDLAAAYGYWSRYDGTPLSQPDGVWRNDDGVFVQVAREWGVDRSASGANGVGRGLLLVDLDHDGFLELVKRPLDGPAEIWRSTCDGSAWLEVELRQASADTRALGATVVATSPDGTARTRWVTAGRSMYSSAPPEVHFGLGDDAVVDLAITWPDGRVSLVPDVPTRRRVRVTRAER